MEAPAGPEVSAVLTVYNKAARLPATISSLRRQMADEGAIEYVFVDDCSTDDSLAVIREATRGAPHVRVIQNERNLGPSIRLNQGARAATGTWIYCLDADDITPKGTIQGMLELLRRHEADLIYGKTERRREAPERLLDVMLDVSAPCTVTDQPLAYVMRGGFVRMALMCRRDLFLAAGGADERIFVQDESLPLRLAAHARRLIDWQARVVLMPQPADDSTAHVSADKTQLHHDAFLAQFYALEALEDAHPSVAPMLYARAVSAFWKYARRKQRIPWLRPAFWRYLEAKCLHPAPRMAVLRKMRAELLALTGIRRP